VTVDFANPTPAEIATGWQMVLGDADSGLDIVTASLEQVADTKRFGQGTGIAVTQKGEHH